MKTHDSSEYLTSVLIRSNHYREFLTQAFDYLKRSKKNYSLTILANKIGCKSKSYPREVMTGRRKLTYDYADRFALAFGIKGESKKLFIKMVELERTAESPQLKNEISVLKKRLMNRSIHKEKKPYDLFTESTWVDVYAALGTIDQGATMNEIIQRTNMTEAKLSLILNAMKQKELIEIDSVTNRFKPGVLHHFFEDVEKDMIFQNRFLEVLDKVKQKARVSGPNIAELFQCSTLSVNAANLPRLKKELRELLNKFVQDSEEADGNKLAHILVSLI